jgi:hypothetical protein
MNTTVGLVAETKSGKPFPVTAGFPAIETVMAKAKAIDPDCEWFYGNVYDLKDAVTPLNWWTQT